MQVTKVLIGIQARSTSERFPRKVFEHIGGKTMIEHVIDAAFEASTYMNRYTDKTKRLTSVALVVPQGDPLVSAYRRRLRVIEGPEQDVLRRYAIAADRASADYVVRLTGDCPLSPSFLITSMVKVALVNGYDYVSNVGDDRTAVDGHDCEVISEKLLKHLDENAKDPAEREHVTLAARKNPPDWAMRGHVVGYLDLSRLKLSVDTPEDLERVRAEYDRIQTLRERATQAMGVGRVHRV